jgi:hypothetical protein
MGSIITKLKNLMSLTCCCPSYCRSSCCKNEIEIKNVKRDRKTDCELFDCLSFHNELTNHDTSNNDN